MPSGFTSSVDCKAGVRAGAVQAQLNVELQQWLNSHRDIFDKRDWGEIPRQHIVLTPAARGIEQLQTDYALGFRLLAALSVCCS